MYKAKVSIRDNNTVNYGAVFSAVRTDDKTKKELMKQVTRNENGGYELQSQKTMKIMREAKSTHSHNPFKSSSKYSNM